VFFNPESGVQNESSGLRCSCCGATSAFVWPFGSDTFRKVWPSRGSS
jgi:hypothetical protein